MRRAYCGGKRLIRYFLQVLRLSRLAAPDRGALLYNTLQRADRQSPHSLMSKDAEHTDSQ